MRALILVDMQNDFVPGGALPVPGGHEVVPVANQLMKRFELVVATQDWHPPGHRSFASQHPGKSPGDVIDLGGLQQILWPDHCVQTTRGAELVGGLDLARLDRVFPKGTDLEIDSYSGFFDNGHRRATGLGDYLEGKGVREVVIAGLATDYCVKFTALDARQLGFGTSVVLEGVRAVELHPGDGERALGEMERAGVRLARAGELAR